MMNVINRCHRDRGGAVLMQVACFLFLAVGLVLAILDLATNQRRIAARQVLLDQAMYVAEG